MTTTSPLALDLTSDFTPRNAAALALASQWAYNLPQTVQGKLAQAIFFDAGPAYVLAFPGTHDLKDWIIDSKFLLKPVINFGPVVRVHDGFYDDVVDIYGLVFDLVTATIASAPKPLFITGHSLGGAVAILCAHMLALRKIAIQAVYTFGQPRVGDRDYAAQYNQVLGAKTFRLVFEDDLVPHVPLPGLFFRYRQNKNEVFLYQHFAGIPHLEFNRSGLLKLAFDGLMLFHAWRLIAACKANPWEAPLELIDGVKKNHAIENYILHLNSLT